MIASVAELSERRRRGRRSGRLWPARGGSRSRTELSFPHPLFRAAIYDDLSPTIRRELHARAAEARCRSRRALPIGWRRRWVRTRQLADELEVGCLGDAAVGDAGRRSVGARAAAHCRPMPEQRERRLLDAAASSSSRRITPARRGRWRPAETAAPAVTRLSGLLDVFTGSPDAEDPPARGVAEP